MTVDRRGIRLSTGSSTGGPAHAPHLLAQPAALLALAGVIAAIGLAYSVAVSANGGRMAILVSVALPALVLAVGDSRAAVTAMVLYLPLMGGVRRVIYTFSPYLSFDPVLLVAPVVSLVLAAHVLVFRAAELRALARRARLARLLLALLAIFVLQLLNPLQRSPIVAAGGGLFYIVPVLWYFFGALGTGPRLARLVPSLLVLAVVTALYGLYQTHVGFPAFDQFWIDHGGYTALGVGSTIRPFSSFPSASEYALFTSGALAAATVYAIRGRRALALLPVPLLLWALLVTGTRGAVVMAAVAVAVTLVVTVRSSFGRLLILVAVIAGSPLASAGLRALPDVVGDRGSVRELLLHQSTGLLDPGDSTLTRSYLPGIQLTLRYVLFSRPLGAGLGSTTLATSKFGVSGEWGAELDVPSIAVSTGIPGLALYVAAIVLALIRASRLARRAGGAEAAALAFLVATLGYWLQGSGWVTPAIIWLVVGAGEAQASSAVGVREAAPAGTAPAAPARPVADPTGA